MDQGAAQPEFLLHAARELARGPIRKRRQRGGLEQLADAPLPFLAVITEQAGKKIGILEHRQGRIEVLAQPLGHIGNAGADRKAMLLIGHIAPQHLDAARFE